MTLGQPRAVTARTSSADAALEAACTGIVVRVGEGAGRNEERRGADIDDAAEVVPARPGQGGARPRA